MFVSAIVVAAGKGKRFGAGKQKLLAIIGAKPVIIYPLSLLSGQSRIKEIIVATSRLNFPAIKEKIKQYKINKFKAIVLGGRRRQDSVENALAFVSPRADLILIHDAARPFLEPKQISKLIKQAAKTGAAILAVPVKNTIKKVTNQGLGAMGQLLVEKTLDRQGLWEIQTPQVFKRDLLFEAYQRFGKYDVTDDAALVERLGSKVSIVEGSYRNIKITTPEDLVIAKAIAINIAQNYV